MELFEFFGFLSILYESIKIITKTSKLMAFISITLLVLSSSLFLLFSYSLRSLVLDMSMPIMQSFLPDPSSLDQSDPSSFTSDPGFLPPQLMSQMDHLKLDFALILALKIAFILTFFAISFFSIIATILASTVSYGRNYSLSIKELILRLARTWKRPLITTFYIFSLGLGYLTSVFFLTSPLLVYPNKITVSVLVVMGITSFIFYLYLSIIWDLAIVISVVEESCHGTKALGKATTIANGKKLHGFMLNLCFNLVVFLIFFLYYVRIELDFEKAMLYGLLVLNFTSWLKIFGCVTYTVLYFQCKKHHGEEIELYGVVEYAKLPTALLAKEIH